MSKEASRGTRADQTGSRHELQSARAAWWVCRGVQDCMCADWVCSAVRGCGCAWWACASRLSLPARLRYRHQRPRAGPSPARPLLAFPRARSRAPRGTRPVRMCCRARAAMQTLLWRRAVRSQPPLPVALPLGEPRGDAAGGAPNPFPTPTAHSYTSSARCARVCLRPAPQRLGHSGRQPLPRSSHQSHQSQGDHRSPAQASAAKQPPFFASPIAAAGPDEHRRQQRRQQRQPSSPHRQP